MQESREWTPPGGTLGEILAETRRRLATPWGAANTGRTRPFPSSRVPFSPPSLAAALRQPAVAVIAEIKRRSPSKGDLNPGLSAGEQAARFEQGGAAAISVLTEPTRFGGSVEDLHEAALATRIPLLKKDFHVSPLQLLEAFDTEASAILLIARALSPGDLAQMMERARRASLEPVVEVRTEAELETVLGLGARIVGVNARDLETLEVDETVPERLIPMIPADVIAIWESGVATRDDVERAAAAGADAVLVGSALSLADDPEQLLASLTTVPRRPRG